MNKKYDKRFDLGNIRKFFPDYPSELDVAKQAGNWIGKATGFHSAALVLNEEYKNGTKDFQANVGKKIDGHALIRTHVQPAILFYISFALELILKAALVKQGALKTANSGKKLPFKSHNLYELAKQINGLSLKDECINCLNQASEIIETDKYPVGLKPKDDFNRPPVVTDYSTFYKKANDLYCDTFKLSTEDNS